MKMKFHYIILLALVISFTSCKKDNYNAPGSFLTGKLVYNSEPINVEYNQVNIQLWQPGFGKLDKIDGVIGQDGSFSNLLFDGNYKLVFAPNQGPFMTKIISAAAKDTIFVSLKGSQTLNIEVLPYYMVRNAAFTYNSGAVTASCKLDKIITDANAKLVERVTLYINKTDFVSGANNIAKTDLSGSAITDLNNVSLSVTVPARVPAQNYVFARIGVKIEGVEKLIFSPITKITVQ